MKEDVDIIRAHLKKPVVMIGLMGAGKTKIGGLLAAALDVPFIDVDQEIEKDEGRAIADIFAKDGEPAFRAIERAKIASLLSGDVTIFAPGGGAMMTPETAVLVRRDALSIWLKADLDILVERTGRNTKRPLLQGGNPRDILAGLIEKRYPVYATADITVESDDAAPDVMTERVIKALAGHLETPH